MARVLNVHLLPELAAPERLAGGTAVIIDVLRASTTIVHALAAGARAVIPCEAVDEAHAAARRLGGDAVLGGERHGVKIDGFALGNSPAEYTPETVGGRTVVFTTTNGTRALLQSKQAERIVIGALVNRAALVAELTEGPQLVHLVCAGTEGEVTGEDVFAAGQIAAMLFDSAGSSTEWRAGNDSARIAVDFARSHGSTCEAVLNLLRESTGGRNLRRLGLEADIERAGRFDRFDLVPEYDCERGTINSQPPVDT